jgi:hypothetical protein
MPGEDAGLGYEPILFRGREAVWIASKERLTTLDIERRPREVAARPRDSNAHQLLGVDGV